MNAITVLNKSNVPIGPFTREQIAEKLNSGEISLSDLAFVEGLAQWTPLEQVLAKIDGTASVPPPTVSSPTVPVPGAPAYSYAATMQPPGHLVYGGFWLRFAAYLIDGLILIVPLIVLIVINNVMGMWALSLSSSLVHTSENTDSSQAANATQGVSMIVLGVCMIALQLIFWAVEILILWLYFAKLESGPHQATFGKRLLNLKVTNLSGEKIGFGQASGRFFGKIISGMTFSIGFIMAGFTERKQALHDLIAGTLVVKK